MFGNIIIQCLNLFFPVDKLPDQVVFLLGLILVIAIFMALFSIIVLPFRLLSSCF